MFLFSCCCEVHLQTLVVCLQVSGAGGWGLPKMPTLRQLFIQCGGLKCIALDSNEDIVFKSSCVNFLASVELHEWKHRPLSEIEVVV